jgi:hypothetical protein
MDCEPVSILKSPFVYSLSPVSVSCQEHVEARYQSLTLSHLWKRFARFRNHEWLVHGCAVVHSALYLAKVFGLQKA